MARTRAGARRGCEVVAREIPCACHGCSPIWIIPALQAGQVLPPVRDIDLLVIDGAQNVPTGALVGTISRAKQLVLVGDLSRRSSGYRGTLRTSRRLSCPRRGDNTRAHIASFLAGHGYGTLGTIPARPSPSRIRLHLVDGVGTPMIGSVSVEGVDAEVERVLKSLASTAPPVKALASFRFRQSLPGALRRR